MKLTITMDEARDIVEQHFRDVLDESDIEIVIEEETIHEGNYDESCDTNDDEEIIKVDDLTTDCLAVLEECREENKSEKEEEAAVIKKIREIEGVSYSDAKEAFREWKENGFEGNVPSC
jgi:hypothetical protein